MHITKNGKIYAACSDPYLLTPQAKAGGNYVAGYPHESYFGESGIIPVGSLEFHIGMYFYGPGEIYQVNIPLMYGSEYEGKSYTWHYQERRWGDIKINRVTPTGISFFKLYFR